MMRIIAGFGGFLGRKGDGHPGPKALWAGMQMLMAYVESIQSLREAFDLEITDLKIACLMQRSGRVVPAMLHENRAAPGA
jgi:hypothetical protein